MTIPSMADAPFHCPPDLTRPELESLHSVLRRAIERAERRKDTELVEKLALEVAAIVFELRGG